MKFAIASDGYLEITAEGRDDAKEILKTFNLDPFEYAERVSAGTSFVYRERPHGRKSDNAAWFECTYTAGPEWIQPYMARLKAITGYDGEIPTIEQAPLFATSTFRYLCPTHHMASARLDASGYTALGYRSCGDWNGRTAAQLAPGYFARDIQKDLGDEKHEREMIEVGNGLFKHNPNYGKFHAPHPAATNAALFGAMLQWWLDTVANDAQRKIAADALACHRTVCKRDTLGEWMLRSYENGWRTSWDGPLVPFTEWQKLTA